MSSFEMGAPLEQRSARLRYWLSAGLMLVAIVLFYLAMNFAMGEYLAVNLVQRWDKRILTQIWFLADGSLAGTRVEGQQLVIERWPLDGYGSELWRVPLPSVAQGAVPAFAVSEDAAHVVWPEGERLQAAELLAPRNGEARRLPGIALQPGARMAAFGPLGGGLAAVLYGDATLDTFRLEDGQRVSQRKLDLPDVDKAAIRGDYLAAASFRSGKMRLYRLAGGGGMSMVDESYCPEPPFDLLIPAAGQMAVLQRGALFCRGRHWNAPGLVRAIAFCRAGDLVSAGEFEGIYRLDAEQKPYRLAVAPHSITLAGNQTHMAFSGPAGTSLFTLLIDHRLTPTGRAMSLSAFGLAGVALLLALSGFLVEGIRAVFRIEKRRGKPVLQSFGDPPPALVEACASGEIVLWAGGGLAAQSGLPLWQDFVRMAVETAQAEGWIDSTSLAAIYSLCQEGRPTDAINQLAAKLGADSSALAGFTRLIYGRHTALSASHRALGRLPTAAAITSNWDSLLDLLGARWASNVLDLRSPRLEETFAAGPFFLLKLYGDLEHRSGALLSPAAMAQAASAQTKLPEILDGLLASRVTLFVGCSAQGLADDLSRLLVPKSRPKRHFALIGVGGSGWERAVGKLHSLYGIDTLLCDEHTVSASLPVFLERLAAQIEQRRSPAETTGAALS